MIHVALPAYNEAENIGALLLEMCRVFAEALPASAYRITVVDDGSNDDTAERVLGFQRAFDQTTFPRGAVDLVRHETNRGLSEAIRTGLTTCAERAQDRDIILTMDADNSHLPGLVPSMVRLIHEGHDVVIASRYQPGARIVGLTWQRQGLSLGASWLMRSLFPIQGVRDYTCGFRAYRAGLLKRVIRETPDFFDAEGFTCMVDILLKLRTWDPPPLMAEVPLLLRYDQKRGASKMDVGRTTRQTLALLARRYMGRR